MSSRRELPAVLLLAASLALQSCVQYSPPGAGVQPAPQAATLPPPGAPGPVDLSLRRLLAPIALYPDPLLALILPACTLPGDLSAANQYLVQYGDLTQLGAQPWDPSVRSLAHYPTVVAWLVDNPEWTREVGSAFVASPSEVLRAVQALRLEAMASGVLASTPQQQVYSEGGEIYILPNQPEAIFVPAYDATVAFSDQGQALGVSCIGFGGAYPVGPWMSLCFDWDTGGLWAGGWSAWHAGGLWHAPKFAASHAPPGFKRWAPSARAIAPTPASPAVRIQMPPPRPIQGTPAIRSRFAESQASQARAASPAPSQQQKGQAPAPARRAGTAQGEAKHEAVATAPAPAKEDPQADTKAR